MGDRYASLKQGLVGAWIPSISGSGLLLPDLSGRGNNGSLTNMDASDWVSSQYGRALDFDGVNDYLTVTDAASLDVTGAITLCAWIKSDGNYGTNGKGIISKYETATNQRSYALLLTSSGNVQVAVTPDGTSASVRAEWGSTVVGTNWRHVAATYVPSTGTVAIYVDGVAESRSNNGGPLPSSIHGGSAPLWVGVVSTLGSNLFFGGRIDDARVFNRALTESEIRLLASEPGIGFKPAKKLSRFSTRYTYKPPKAKVFEGVRVRDHDYSSLRNGLVGAWCPSLPNGGSGNTLPDVSGYGNHGVLTNMSPDDWVSGQYGRALDFDGVNDYASIADSNQLDVTGPVTLAIWVRGTSTANRILTEKGTNKTLVLQPNGPNEFYYLDGSAGPAIVSNLNTLIFNGNWHSITATFNGATRALYVDGIVRHTSAMSTPTANADEFVVGARSGGAFGWAGQLDDIRIYNRALTEPEIRLLASRRGIGLQPSPTRFIAREKKTGLRRKILTGQT